MQTALRAKSYAYDASSKVTSHTVDGVTTSYTYDGAGQLLTESRPGYSASYTYDGNGNRLTRTANGVTETYAYDDGDKLLSVSVGGSPVKTYGYDLAGRTTTVVSSSGTTSIGYDFEGRATSIVGPGVNQTNVYNGLDTRVGSTTYSVTRTFLRDGAYVTDPVLKDGAATYTPGVSERRGTATTYLHSGLKNADAQSSVSQALTGTHQYDAFGNLASSTGTWQGPFGYGGGFGYQEDATGLRLLGHRLYDASTGRFLPRDPIKDGRNWYVYCENDPVAFNDPAGLAKVILFWYHVAFGGYHAGILVIDDNTGDHKPVYSAAGGPRRGKESSTFGNLVSQSGPWQPGTQNHGKWNGGGVFLVDDDLPAEVWIKRIGEIERKMRSTPIKYEPVPDLTGKNGNSNSWSSKILRELGLLDEYDHAIRKRGSAPWTPGWGKDVW